ncbi:MAG: deoxyribose-phosphate aldolase [Bryobacteraceae bacterium]
MERLVARIGEEILARAAAPLIDHTILKPEATEADVRRYCREAMDYGFASVCVNPCRVPLAAAALAGSTVKVCTVVGFPLGAAMTEVKMLETEIAIRAGAREIDMVLNVGALKNGDFDRVRLDIAGVTGTAHGAGAIVKVILETALLTEAEKSAACDLAVRARADFVKTSTGFGPGGATVDDVALLRRCVGTSVGVKASGGIRTIDDLRRMVKAGANRIGASASVAIMEAASRAGE